MTMEDPKNIEARCIIKGVSVPCKCQDKPELAKCLLDDSDGSEGWPEPDDDTSYRCVTTGRYVQTCECCQ